jgi:hypothetical protein
MIDVEGSNELNKQHTLASVAAFSSANRFDSASSFSFCSVKVVIGNVFYNISCCNPEKLTFSCSALILACSSAAFLSCSSLSFYKLWDKHQNR